MIVHMLQQHPDIDVSAAEALAREAEARGRGAEDGAEYVRSVIYGQAPAGQAVGFKFAYGHADTSPHSTAWDLLAGGDIRVVHMYRLNILDYVISVKLANSQNRWIAVGREGEYERQPVVITIDELHAWDSKVRRGRERVLSLVPEERRLELPYERLVEDPAAWLAEILGFLGVPFLAIAPQTRRQRTFTRRIAVANYDELQAEVSTHHPEWLRFFDDDAERPPGSPPCRS